MKSVAEAAGVSVVTVSLALRNHPSIPAKTRARIQRVATRLGYRTNPMVAALMSQLRSARAAKGAPVIAFLVFHPKPERFAQRDFWLGALYAGAEARAQRLGYKLERFWLNEPGMTEERMRKILQARGIRAAIMAPLVEPIPRIEFNWDGFACATTGYSYNNPVLHRVAHDQFSAIRMAIARLTELGYQRIGLAIRFVDDLRTGKRWSGGFLSEHAYLPPERRLPIFFWHVGRPEGFQEWVREQRPDAIITLHSVVKDWLLAMGMQPPRDIGLASLNLQGDQIGWTGVNEKHDLLGSGAIDLVVEQIYHNEHGVPVRPKTTMVLGDWVEGNTTRRVSHA